jgi:hypothetical protein
MELLVHKGRGDPNDPSDYQPGDVVTMLPDGTQWGSACEGPNADDCFIVIKLPGVSIDETLREEEWEHNAEGKPMKMLKRRKRRIPPGLLNGLEQSSTLAPGEITALMNQIEDK